MLLTLWGVPTFGQADPPPADEPPAAAESPADGLSNGAADAPFAPQIREGPVIVLDLFHKSRVINSVILAFSIIAMLLFLFFLLTITGRSMAPPVFVSEVDKLLRDKDFAAAADYCRRNRRIFVASIIQRCIENHRKNHSLVMRMVETEGARRAEIIWNRISYLADVSSVAPMLGLLGTVVGMIEAFFFALPEGSASISSQVLAKAIGGAMATTMFGLIVGIMALIFYSIIRSRLTRAMAEAEQVVHTVADELKRGQP